MYSKFEKVYLNIIKEDAKHSSKRHLIKEERMSEERQKELYELALNLFENYKWNDEEAKEEFQADYPHLRRDFIDDYSNHSVSDEEFTKDFTETMDYYNNHQYLEESKKINKKRPVIKESKLVSKRHIIKEDYSICDAMKKYFDKYNKEYFDNLGNKDEIDEINEQKRNAYWGAISDVLKQNDPEKVKAFLNNIKELGDVEWKIITQQSGLDITPEQINIFEDFSAFNEMAEKWFNPYWGDGWMSEDVCEALEKAGYGEYIDKITEFESKKVDKSKKVIKESTKRPIRRHNRRQIKK